MSIVFVYSIVKDALFYLNTQRGEEFNASNRLQRYCISGNGHLSAGFW